jgi:hypothetical protein
MELTPKWFRFVEFEVLTAGEGGEYCLLRYDFV